MNSSYVKALETKARWQKWFAKSAWDSNQVPVSARHAIRGYETVLNCRDTHFMNARFCDLVDHARQSVPDDLKFDLSWTHDQVGWMWLEKPFECPKFIVLPQVVEAAKKYWNPTSRLKDWDKTMAGQTISASLEQKPETPIDVSISAVGWIPIGEIEEREEGQRYGEFTAGEGKQVGTAFLLFHDLDDGFGMWSYFTLTDGDSVINRIRAFEQSAKKEGGNYRNDRESDMLHEIRWVYTAFHLMAQKLAVKVPVAPDRAQRKRAAREGRKPEEIKVVSLRRLEAAREKAAQSGQKQPVDWNWQWEVRGHWRNQWYAAAGEHRSIFIEAYFKGPEDKPLKDPGKKLFVAVR